MTDLEAYRLENKYPVRVIESSARGLKYLVDDDRREKKIGCLAQMVEESDG